MTKNQSIKPKKKREKKMEMRRNIVKKKKKSDIGIIQLELRLRHVDFE